MERVCERDDVEPSCLNVYIGPHIHACHFEVGEDLACRFANEFGPSVLTDDRHVSLSAALRCGLTSLGVDERRIADAGYAPYATAENAIFRIERAEDGVAGMPRLLFDAATKRRL